MTKSRFLLFHLICILAGAFLINLLYSANSAGGALKLPLTKIEIEQRANLFLQAVGIDATGFIADAVLLRDRGLMRQIHLENGVEVGNRAMRDAVPAFFWEVRYLKDESLFAGLLKIFSREAGEKDYRIEMLKSLKLDFDSAGKLKSFQRSLPDSVKLPSISRSQAWRIVHQVIQNYAPQPTKLIEQEIEDDSSQAGPELTPLQTSGSRLGHDFRWKTHIKPLPQQIDLTAHISGNQLLSIQTEYNVPVQFRPGQNPLMNYRFPIILIILGIVAFYIALKRWRANEMDFQLGLAIGLLGAVTFSVNFFLGSYRQADTAPVVLATFINAIFIGAPLILVWAVGESVTREVWGNKFIPLDLIRKKQLFHSQIGRNVIRGISFAIVGVAISLLSVYVLRQYTAIALMSIITGGNSIFSSVNPVLRGVPVLVFHSVWIITLFVVFGMSLTRRWVQSPLLLVGLWTLIITTVHWEDAEPFGAGLVIEGGLILMTVWAFYRYNILAAFVTLFLGNFILQCSPLFFVENSTYLFSGYILMSLLICGVLYGIVTLYTQDQVTDLARVAPTYYRNISERERLKKELEIARSVQMDFLPRENPRFTMLDIASHCKPALEVGGDYYDFIELGGNRLGIVIGDVSGKGTRAAFYMTLTKGFLRALANMSESPAFVLTQLNRLFYDNVPRGVFISMIYGIFDLDEGVLTLARAGHNPVVMRRTQDSQIENIYPNGIALGMERGHTFEEVIQEVRVSFKENDLFVLYTDGFTEAMNGSREEFGEERFESAIERHSAENAEGIMGGIFHDVAKFTGKAKQHDDMTIVVVKIGKQEGYKMGIGRLAANENS